MLPQQIVIPAGTKFKTARVDNVETNLKTAIIDDSVNKYPFVTQLPIQTMIITENKVVIEWINKKWTFDGNHEDGKSDDYYIKLPIGTLFTERSHCALPKRLDIEGFFEIDLETTIKLRGGARLTTFDKIDGNNISIVVDNDIDVKLVRKGKL